DKSFSQNGHLILHLKSHNVGKPYHCIHCGKAFSQNGHLITHLKLSFRCSVLEKDFTQKNSTLSHIETKTGEKSYQCNHCKKLFSHNYHLACHMRTHTGEKPYQCIHCQKSFSHSYQLIRHLRTHTGDRPYQCSHCDKAFAENGHLKTHLKLSFRCSISEKEYTQGTNILSQTLTHPGEKPVQFRNSEKDFSTNPNRGQMKTQNEDINQSSQSDNAFSHNNNLIHYNDCVTSKVRPAEQMQDLTRISIISKNQVKRQHLDQDPNLPYLVPFSYPTPSIPFETNPIHSQNIAHARRLQFPPGSEHLYHLYSSIPIYNQLIASETYCRSDYADFSKTRHTYVPLDLTQDPNKKYATNNADTKQTHITPHRPWETPQAI
ncbi:unnamed protein product, partial [Meganyctiphanes norvegica]